MLTLHRTLGFPTMMTRALDRVMATLKRLGLARNPLGMKNQARSVIHILQMLDWVEAPPVIGHSQAVLEVKLNVLNRAPDRGDDDDLALCEPSGMQLRTDIRGMDHRRYKRDRPQKAVC